MLGIAESQYNDSISALDPKYNKYRSEGEAELEKFRQEESNRTRGEYLARGIGDSEQAVQGLGKVDTDWRDKVTSFLDKLYTARSNEESGLRSDLNTAKSGAYQSKAQVEAQLQELAAAREQQQFNNELALEELGIKRSAASGSGNRDFTPTQLLSQNQAYYKALPATLAKFAKSGDGSFARENAYKYLSSMFPNIDDDQLFADVFGSAGFAESDGTISRRSNVSGLGMAQENGWEDYILGTYGSNAEDILAGLFD